MAARRFHIGVVLTVTTGRILPPHGVPGVQTFLEYMTGGGGGGCLSA